MKIVILAVLVSLSAFAQFPKMPTVDTVKDLSKEVLAACKEDKSKIEGCESYTEIKELKACLMKNKEKLSKKCLTALKLVK